MLLCPSVRLISFAHWAPIALGAVFISMQPLRSRARRSCRTSTRTSTSRSGTAAAAARPRPSPQRPPSVSTPRWLHIYIVRISTWSISFLCTYVLTSIQLCVRLPKLHFYISHSQVLLFWSAKHKSSLWPGYIFGRPALTLFLNFCPFLGWNSIFYPNGESYNMP